MAPERPAFVQYQLNSLIQPLSDCLSYKWATTVGQVSFQLQIQPASPDPTFFLLAKEAFGERCQTKKMGIKSQAMSSNNSVYGQHGLSVPQRNT